MTDMAIVLFVVKALAKPTPCLPGAQPAMEPAEPKFPSDIAGKVTCKLLSEPIVMLLFPTLALVLDCRCPIQYSPAVKVVTRGILKYFKPVQ